MAPPQHYQGTDIPWLMQNIMLCIIISNFKKYANYVYLQDK